MVSVALLSDIHCHEVEVPEVDLAVFAGDLTFNGDLHQMAKWRDYLLRLKERNPTREIVWIGGNHDWGLQTYRYLGPQYAEETKTHYLQETGIEICGLKVWGSPYTPAFGNWAFMYPRYMKDWKNIPEGLDILITHGPAHGMLDLTPGDEHVGCEDLCTEVFRKNPRVHVAGHIHHSYGMRELNGIHFYNASVVSESYKNVNKPWIIEL